MNDYEFYLEFDGSKTYNQNYAQMIKEYTADKAATKFAKEIGLTLLNIESVIGNDEHYRAYFLEKRLFKKNKEHIYLIKKRVISISM